MAIRSSALLGLSCLLCLTAIGCASNTVGKRGEQKGFLSEITPEQRRAAAIEKFEQRRHSAQYSSALSRWNVGDVVGCKMLLETLLQQDPDDREARRLLADVCLEQSDTQAAEMHLRILLEGEPDDAQSHHSLGLLLEETGHRDESLRHLDRAVELDPHNELYALSRDAGAGQGKRQK